MKLQRQRGEQLPVNLAMLKRHLRITSDAFDDDLQHKLWAAIQRAENWMNRILIPSEFTQTEQLKPVILLSVFDVDEIVSVEVDGTALQPEQYTWDGDRLLKLNSVTGSTIITKFKAGGVEVEEDIKAGILMDAGSLFTNPLDRVESLPKASQRIYDQYKYARR